MFTSLTFYDKENVLHVDIIICRGTQRENKHPGSPVSPAHRRSRTFGLLLCLHPKLIVKHIRVSVWHVDKVKPANTRALLGSTAEGDGNVTT